MTWDRLSEAQWEATCSPCQRDEHEECLLAVRFDSIPVPCACGCRDARADSRSRRAKSSTVPLRASGGHVTTPRPDANDMDVTIPPPNAPDFETAKGRRMTTEERAAVEAWMKENEIPWPTTYTKEEGQA